MRAGAKRGGRKRGHTAQTTRLRPKLATTVALETLDAVKLLAGDRKIGHTLDRLVWYAICQRLTELTMKLRPAEPSSAPSHELLLDDTHASAVDPEEDGVDRALVAILMRERRRFESLPEEDQKKLRAELSSAHETRKAMGRFSPISDFVRLFVATNTCPAC
jgi:hypothetical protein